MWSFEGDYKQRPKQSLGGKSKAIDKETLLFNAQTERKLRELAKKEEESAKVLQAWYRGNLKRKECFNKFRIECDVIMSQISKEELTEENVQIVLKILTRIFDPKLDSERLIKISQYLILSHAKVFFWICSSFLTWKHLIPKLIGMTLKNLLHISNYNERKFYNQHAVSLRLLEIISFPEHWHNKLSDDQRFEFLSILYIHLIKIGYYKILVNVLLLRTPDLYAITSSPPNPIAESIVKLLIRPVIILLSNNNKDVRELLLQEISYEIFDRMNHNQILYFCIPYLAKSSDFQIILKYYASYVIRNFDDLAANASAGHLLYSLLSLQHSKTDINSTDEFIDFLTAVGRLMEVYVIKRNDEKRSLNDSDDDDDEDDEYSSWYNAQSTHQSDEIFDLCISDLNGTERVTWILFYVEKFISSARMIVSFAKLFHFTCLALKYKLHDCRLFFSVVLKRHLLLRPMWSVLSSLQQGQIVPVKDALKNVTLLQILSLGFSLTPVERDSLVPLLSTFSASLIAVLATLHDSELLGKKGSCETDYQRVKSTFPFSVDELVQMSAVLRDVCIGLVELAHPDMRMAAQMDSSYKTMWTHCFKVCIDVVRQLHLRDTRRQFCPKGHWLSHKVFLHALSNKDVTPSVSWRRHRRRERRRFEAPRWLTKEELEQDGPPLSVAEQRRSTLLHEIPFVFAFDDRMSVFSAVISNDRATQQSTASYGVGPNISITVRRTHLYEDSFDKLSPSNEPNLRLSMRVNMLNAVGLNEAGIDGGGIFREFLSELLKTAFDPNRGFFVLTKDNTLYPNPGARFISDNYEHHYYFIGRMLGKALYANLLVEIPLASFFLSKILSVHSSSVEFHHLDSLDPELCKNLLSLKNYEGDVQDLGLDFTVLSSDLGQHSVQELMINGSNIAVTNENCIEYIYRMADYKLNKQIGKQYVAFKEGIFNVIDSAWIGLFDWRELQMLISGNFAPIDVDELQSNTVYSGNYNEKHATVIYFWNVVKNFDETQRGKLLKFVTSCSRPPLLGFKELFPAFGIQPSGSEDRLPSASTCMNLLKLPEYTNEQTLKEKLIYAINSSAGFELS